MKSKKMIKNYIYNTMYQILVLIAPLITIPYVSRVLGVTNIGIYQYTQSVATYFVLIGAVGTSLYGQREIAYLQDYPKERSVAFWEIELFRMTSVFLFSLIYLFIFKNGLYAKVYQILFIEVIASAFDISWFFMGMENFRITVIRNIFIKFMGVILVFILVKGPNDLLIYTVCVTLPILIGNISLWPSLKKHIINPHISVKEMWIGIKHRIPFILTLFLPQIAIDIYTVLDKTMLGLLATNIDQVGYYAQAQRIVRLVLTVVTSLGTVMLPSMSAAFSRKDNKLIYRYFTIALRFVFLLGSALLFGLCAIAERFVPIFFGNGYDLVVNLLIVISPILLIISVSNIISYQYLLPTNRQKIFTLSIIVGAAVNFILNFILILFFDAIGASIATVIAELTVTTIQCYFVHNELPIIEAIRTGLRYLLCGTIMFIVVRGSGLLLPQGNIWSLGIMIIVGIVTYMTELLIIKDPILKMGINLARNKEK